MDDESVLAQGGVERIGLDEAFLKLTLPNGEKKIIKHDMHSHDDSRRAELYQPFVPVVVFHILDPCPNIPLSSRKRAHFSLAGLNVNIRSEPPREMTGLNSCFQKLYCS